MVGVERERLRRLTLPTLERAAFDALVAELLAAGRLAASRAWLHLPQQQASLAAGDRDLFAVLKPLLDAQALGPPRVRDVARAADLRDRIGGGRKVAIHILEFLDRIGYTRRVRDEHLLRGSGATHAWLDQ